jgi:hypothetical protein
MVMEYSKSTAEINREITKEILKTNSLLLDELCWTVIYSFEATLYYNNRNWEEWDIKYQSGEKQIKIDLNSAPNIEERLEELKTGLPYDNITMEFANKHLPFVKDFNVLLLEYAKLKGINLPNRNIDYAKLSKEITQNIKSLPDYVRSSVVYTVFSAVDSSIYTNPRFQKSWDERYQNNRKLLEEDLVYGPIIMERLQTFIKTLDDHSILKLISKKHLPLVKEYNERLNQYAIDQNKKN